MQREVDGRQEAAGAEVVAAETVLRPQGPVLPLHKGGSPAAQSALPSEPGSSPILIGLSGSVKLIQRS